MHTSHDLTIRLVHVHACIAVYTSTNRSALCSGMPCGCRCRESGAGGSHRDCQLRGLHPDQRLRAQLQLGGACTGTAGCMGPTHDVGAAGVPGYEIVYLFARVQISTMGITQHCVHQQLHAGSAGCMRLTHGMGAAGSFTCVQLVHLPLADTLPVPTLPSPPTQTTLRH